MKRASIAVLIFIASMAFAQISGLPIVLSPVGSGSGSGSGSVWVDAGTPPGVSDGGFFGVYLDTVPQTLVGATNISFAGVPYTPVEGLNNPNRNSNVYVFRDGGTAMMLHTRHNVPSLSRTSFLPISAAYQGANLYIYADTTVVSSASYSQILFQANNTSTPSSTAANDFITSYRTGGAIGSDGAFANGLNLHAGTNGYITLSSGGDTSNFPTLFVAPNSQISMGQGNVTAGTTVTLNSASLTTGLSINSAVVGISFASNSMDLDLGTGASDYFESNGTRIVTPGGLNVANARIVGNTASSVGMLDSTTVGTGTIGFRQSDNQHYKVVTGRNFAPILSGSDWLYDGKIWTLEVTDTLTSCPIIRDNIAQLDAAGTAVSVSCTDSAAASATVAGTPSHPYRVFSTLASAGSRSIVMAGTAPASGASATPQSMYKRRAGGVFGFWMLTGSAVSSQIAYGGFTDAVPTSGVMANTSNSIMVQHSTTAGNTTWQLCGCNGTSCTCGSSSVTVAANTEYLMEVDCRETTSACYLYINGTFAATTATLPTTTTGMGFAYAIEATSAAARTLGLGRTRLRSE